MNYNPNPRETFRSEPNAAANHHTLVESHFLRGAMTAALAEYTRQQSSKQAADLGGAASCFMRIQGAHELVETFYNLAEATTLIPTTDNFNLAGNIKQTQPVKRN